MANEVINTVLLDSPVVNVVVTVGQGPAGPAGLTGDTGPAGADSTVQGPAGADGAQGIQGPAGADGAQGIQGPAGADGAQGIQGPAGADGAQGIQGPTGADGAQGIQGPAGADGAQGIQGPAGADGAAGLDGEVGPQGPAGADGASVVTLSYGKTGVQTVSTGTARLYPPRALTLSKWEIWTGTAPTGSNLIAAVKKNGTLIETLTLTAGSNYSTGVATTALLATDYLTVDITQIGSTVAGSDLSIRLTGN